MRIAAGVISLVLFGLMIGSLVLAHSADDPTGWRMWMGILGFFITMPIAVGSLLAFGGAEYSGPGP